MSELVVSTPQVPDCSSVTLVNLLPAIGAQFGLAASDVFGLPKSRRYVVLLVDGLGWESLVEYADPSGPLSAGSVDSAVARPISVGAPSTTVTSLTSLGTGLPPGQHGIVGHSFRYGGQLLSPLLGLPGVDGQDLQPRLTWFERFEKAGVRASIVVPAQFAGSLLTQAVFRGARFLGVSDETDTATISRLAVIGSQTSDTTLTYVYLRAVDQAGHAAGVGSAAWLAALQFANSLTAQLRTALTDDVVLLIVADHGMVNVPATSRVVIEDVPQLAKDVTMIAGEARFRHLYLKPGQREAVAARWGDYLGDTAWVRTKDEAIAQGWFGPVSGLVASRIGDVVVAARGLHGLFTQTYARELRLVGMHGSFMSMETQVPLIVM